MRAQSLASFVVTGVALALVAHLWMFGAHGDEVPPDTTETAAAVSLPRSSSLHVAGCASGMSGCRVPMPTSGLAVAIVLALAGWVLTRVGFDDAPGEPVSPVASPERAPPPTRPSVLSSVVLLE